MPPRPHSNTSSEAILRRALSESSIGADALFADLTELDVLGTIAVRDGTTIVPIELPVPSETIRSGIESEVRAVEADIEGVTDTVVRWEPSVPDSGPRVDLLPDVKNLVAVGSGKGGVGKSTVATNLATSLADAGADVGILDADVYGPNAPAMLGLDEQSPTATLDSRIVPREAHGVKVMSMGFIVGEDDPVIWRGPLVDDVLKQLFEDVQWGSLDYLFVDLPPGTGDAQLSLVQHLPVTGVVIVTTPQPVAVDDARRGLSQFVKYEVPVLGVVENMSGFVCPDCDSKTDIFGTGGGQALADEFDVPLLASVPLDPETGPATDTEKKQPPGVRVPIMGRLQLPRTREERTGHGGSPPLSIRDTDSEVRDGLRTAASRVAARVAHLAAKTE